MKDGLIDKATQLASDEGLKKELADAKSKVAADASAAKSTVDKGIEKLQSDVAGLKAKLVDGAPVAPRQ